MADPRPWLFCQIGAREHFALPRELNRRGMLRALVTDAWAPPSSLAARLPGSLGERLAERYEHGLAEAVVVRFTGALLQFELGQKLLGKSGWTRVIARNRWFEARAVRAIERGDLLAGKPPVFAYSYAARDIFRVARAAGCPTVLGQIDPATTEEELVAEAVAAHPELGSRWRRAPERYWQHWREECALADRIVVNSEWARAGLERAGVAADKLRIVPLAYRAPGVQTVRAWPDRFDEQRPLRVLFLGSFIIRKGAAGLLAAARLMRNAPVEFHVVGGSDISIPAEDIGNPKLILHGAVPRHQVHDHFAAADVFILPTLSDGFGLTLVEAQAHGLPVIASRHCGDVVHDRVDGIVLDDVTGPAIAAAIQAYLADPGLAARHGMAAEAYREFLPDKVGDRLLSVLD